MVGKIVVPARIENVSDSLNVKGGLLTADKVRAVEVPDALVDTGAKLLSLPKRLIDHLGLEFFETRPALTSVGYVPRNIYRAVWLTIQGRRCTVDVVEVPDECPVCVGYVPLELLDFVADPTQQKLIGNPQHGGEHILDLL